MNSHQDLFNTIKCAASAEAKVDALADLVYKIIINDLRTLEVSVGSLEKRIRTIEKWVWRVGGIFAAAIFIGQIALEILF